MNKGTFHHDGEAGRDAPECRSNEYEQIILFITKKEKTKAKA